MDPTMDHSTMDHSGHMDAMEHMGHMPMEPAMCSMNMLFTWDTTNLCIVFRWWHVQTNVGLVLSLLTIVLLGMGYEYLRRMSRWIESVSDLPTGENGPLLDANSINRSPDTTTAQRYKLYRALTYAFQVAYSFFLMLIFMTYNGWAMLAVTVGAFAGFYIWGDRKSTRDMACH